MAARRDRDRDRNRNAIRGPQSALTDFLAANNISAHQIRLDYERRRREAELAAEQNGLSADPEEQPEESASESETEAESSKQAKKRKRKQDATIQKIKASKKFQKMRKGRDGGVGEDDDDEMAWNLYEKSKPLPGQLENCEECAKRFTVTPYTKEGPGGGLLCTKCSKAQEAEKKKVAQNKKSRVAREHRRKMQSDLLDGARPQGVKTLAELCVEKVAENIHEVDEFGDLPPKLLDRLSQILSKRRLLNSQTLGLFLGPERDGIAIYDCGKLENDDFIRILQMSPNVKGLTLENAGQIKDNVIDFILERDFVIESLKLEAANLVTDSKWREFFSKMGHRLRELKLTWLDSAMDDETVAHIVDNCPNLTYLKLKKCFRLTESSIAKITELKQLKHLHLCHEGIVDGKVLCDLIASVGSNLQALTLDGFTIGPLEGDKDGPQLNQNGTDDNPASNTLPDDLLHAIHTHCRQLVKLRITANDQFTDEGLADLFTDWPNPPLISLNFSSIRSMDETMAIDDEENEENAEDVEGVEGEGDKPARNFVYGLGHKALSAILKHSGMRLERLVLSSCRHIGHVALLEAFVEGHEVVNATTKNAVNGTVYNSVDGVATGLVNGLRHAGAGRYPNLKDVDFSFVGGVDTTVVAGIFRSAPRLERLAVFGCFGVKGALVPPGVALIGLPNAQEQIIMEG